jgi:hypothetical protein
MSNRRCLLIILVLSFLAAPSVLWAQPSVSIELEMTLMEDSNGMPGDDCGVTDNLVVEAGTDVEVCYTVTNTGTATLNFHDLVDSEFGAILTNFPFALTAGASVFVTQSIVANTDLVFNGTWTAYNDAPVDGIQVDVVESSDSATLTIAERAAMATFEVIKDFSDDNPGEVEVTLDCFTGLPITQSQTISESQNVVFIVEAFADGELDCNVTESDVLGYSASYSNGELVVNDESCAYQDVSFEQEKVCTITNTPVPVEVSVYKDWIIDGEGGDSIDPYYRLTLACFGEIVEGFTHGPSGIWRLSLYDGSYLGTADVGFKAYVVPDWDGGTDCWVLETVFDSAVEVNNGCGSNGDPGIVVELAGGGSCTVTNTVFFEGIPTLSQYGMAILALLMLGVGFVGFRRFV